MKIRDLIPWRSQDEERRLARREDPFENMRREMNRLFDEFFERNELMPFEGGLAEPTAVAPKLDVSETETEFRISAELPGMDEKDIDVSLSGNLVTIRGEKKFEKKTDEEDFHRVERSYGAFHRSLPLPAEVDPEKADATFKNGVLELVLPKTKPGPGGKKIAVKRSE